MTCLFPGQVLDMWFMQYDMVRLVTRPMQYCPKGACKSAWLHVAAFALKHVSHWRTMKGTLRHQLITQISQIYYDLLVISDLARFHDSVRVTVSVLSFELLAIIDAELKVMLIHFVFEASWADNVSCSWFFLPRIPQSKSTGFWRGSQALIRWNVMTSVFLFIHDS